MPANHNAATWFVDRHLTTGRGGHSAFVEADGAARSLTYGALAEQTDRLAGALTRADIRREDRALMLVLDQIEFPVIFWGALKAGVVPVPINTKLTTEVYRTILDDSRATCLFVSAPLLPAVLPAARAAPFLRRIVVIEDAGTPAPEGTAGFASFMAEAVPQAAVAVHPDEVAFWLYSSGSTGQPKGVRHVHASLRATAETYGAQVLQITSDDTVHSVAKLFFAYGLGNAMTFPMSVGATAVLVAERPTPAATAAILASHRPTIFCGVPTLYAALTHYFETAETLPDTRLRRCISAGEALPGDIGRRWASLWGVDIMDGVGSTEMLHIFLSNAPGDTVYGTSGTAVPGYDIRLVDEDGADIPDAGPLTDVTAVGEMLVRGSSAADGYWNNRAKSRATFLGDWTRTGDKYTRTADGRFVYCGRTDDMFKVSGQWVSPFEVEQALVAHPAVLEAAVVAQRDADGLEKPKAIVVLKSGSTVPADLADSVKARVGAWKYPRWIEVAEDLPKTATGKIQRFKLR